MKKSHKTLYRTRNWREYSAALVNRGSLTVWIDENVAKTWINTELSGGKGASDYYSDTAIMTVLMLKEVFALRLRQSEGFTRSVLQLMGLELDVPNYSTLCRRRKRLAVSLGATPSNQRRHLVVDSTGVKIYGEGEWKVRQHGASKRRTWRKLHLGVDATTHEIVAAVATSNNLTDAMVFGDLLDQVDGDIAQVSADGAYDKRAVYTAINERNAQRSTTTRAVIPPRRNAKIWKHGNTKAERLDRDENLRSIRKHGRAAWKRQSQYHRRSLAETGMYRFKTIFGERLNARLFESQATEMFIKCAALNTMTRLGMPDTYAVVA